MLQKIGRKLILNNSYFKNVYNFRTLFKTNENLKLILNENQRKTNSNRTKIEISSTLFYLTLLSLNGDENDDNNKQKPLHLRRTKFNFIADVVEIVQPSVVQIELLSSGFFNQATRGSGFIVSEDGYILTNAHVVSNQKKVKIKLYNGEEIPGNIVKIDELSDVAVIKINKVICFFLSIIFYNLLLLYYRKI
jgi:S1-C subfamily serine protease